jgi:RHS repeat-associated protein
MNRLTNKVADPYFGSYWVKYKYSANGSLTNVVDSLNRNVTNVYDVRNRLEKKITPEGVLQYSYDGNNNIKTAKAFSDIACTIPHSSGYSVAYTWDTFNRLKSVVETPDINGEGPTTVYEYDELERLKECAYPTTTVVKHTYGYNDASWLSSVTISGVPTTAFTYSFNGASGANPWYPGRTGARTGVSESLNGGSRVAAYNYDRLYRLTKENISSGTPSGLITYDSTEGYGDSTGFDKVGNRRKRESTVSAVSQVPTYSYDYNDRLDNDTIQTTPSTYFDSNGSTTSDSDGFIYGYDFENRLVSRTKTGTATLGFAYDHSGNRISKTVSGATPPTIYFLIDEQTPTGYPQVVEELSATTPPALLKTYNYGLRLISQKASGGSSQYYGHDGHGNVRLLTDSAGVVLNTYTYDAFGIQIASTVSTENRYRYCGEQWDPDLGMYYLRARYYSPEKGRFWTMDTFEGNRNDPLSLHKYLYAADDPVNGVDPSGHETSFIGQLATQAAILTVATLTVNSITTAVASKSITKHILKKGAFPDHFYVNLGAAGQTHGFYGGVSGTIMWDLKTGTAYGMFQREAGLSPVSRFGNFRGFGGMVSAGLTFNSSSAADFAEWGFQAAWPAVMYKTVLRKELHGYFNWLTTLAARIGTRMNPSTQLTKSSGAIMVGQSTSGAASIGYAVRQNAFAAAITYTSDPVEIPVLELPDWAVDVSNELRSLTTWGGE